MELQQLELWFRRDAFVRHAIRQGYIKAPTPEDFGRLLNAINASDVSNDAIQGEQVSEDVPESRDLLAAMWAVQLPARLEANELIDISSLSDEVIRTLFAERENLKN